MKYFFVPAAKEDRLPGEYQSGSTADRAIKHLYTYPLKVGKGLLFCLNGKHADFNHNQAWMGTMNQAVFSLNYLQESFVGRQACQHDIGVLRDLFA